MGVTQLDGLQIVIDAVGVQILDFLARLAQQMFEFFPVPRRGAVDIGGFKAQRAGERTDPRLGEVQVGAASLVGAGNDPGVERDQRPRIEAAPAYLRVGIPAGAFMTQLEITLSDLGETTIGAIGVIKKVPAIVF